MELCSGLCASLWDRGLGENGYVYVYGWVPWNYHNIVNRLYPVLCLVTQSCPTLWDAMDCSPPGSSVYGDSPGKNTGVGCYTLLQGNLPNPGIKPRFPALQVDSLPSEATGKPRNTGVDSLSLLPDPGIKLGFPALQADSLAAEPPGKPRLYPNTKQKV